MTMENKPQPFDAFQGGSLVLAAIKEVTEHGGSIGRAIQAGEAALRNLRRSTAEINPHGEVNKGIPETAADAIKKAAWDISAHALTHKNPGIPVYRMKDATDDVLGKDGE